MSSAAPSAPARRRLRLATALPGLVVVAAALIGLFASPSAARSDTASQALRMDATAPITYSAPSSPQQIAAGDVLFQQNCASCHGADASGGVGPNLRGLGAATIDFWVSTGRMPLANAAVQAVRKPPRFNRQQTLDIVAYVNSLQPPAPGRVGIPTVDTAGANLAEGQSLFVLNCAACHTITGSGDALANNFSAPTLHKATATQVAEAIRTGPGNMPWFGPNELTDQQVADIVAYVKGPIQHPDNAGGVGLGGIGPVAEGFVGLLVGVGGIMLIAYWQGERA